MEINIQYTSHYDERGITMDEPAIIDNNIFEFNAKKDIVNSIYKVS